MKFCWSTLRVRNLGNSIKFYTEIVGLKVESRFSAGPETSIAFLDGGGAKIELLSDGLDRQTEVGGDISWGFEVESLDKTLQILREKGIKIESGPIQPNPHLRFLFIKDPDGMKIQLVENIKA